MVSQGMSMLTHGSLNARPNFCKSGTPILPCFFGRFTLPQLTSSGLHWPFLFRFQRKDLQIQSFFLCSCQYREGSEEVSGCGQNETSGSIPALLSRWPCYPGNLLLIFFISGCTCILWSSRVCSRSPRYLHGKVLFSPWKAAGWCWGQGFIVLSKFVVWEVPAS